MEIIYIVFLAFSSQNNLDHMEIHDYYTISEQLQYRGKCSEFIASAQAHEFVMTHANNKASTYRINCVPGSQLINVSTLLRQAERWPIMANTGNLCLNGQLETVIQGTMISYNKKDKPTTHLAEESLKKLSNSQKSRPIKIVELQSNRQFSDEFDEPTKKLINRYINSGDPHFVIVYACELNQILNVAMYADSWGVRKIQFRSDNKEDLELDVKGIYYVGEKYRGQQLNKTVINAITRDFRTMLKDVFDQKKGIKIKH